MKLCKGIAITLRANEEDTIASEQSGYYQEQPYEFTDVFAAPPVHESYDVSAHTVPGLQKAAAERIDALLPKVDEEENVGRG